jgi:uncharacterized surface protein with fasciclin (FAS1) repeats
MNTRKTTLAAAACLAVGLLAGACSSTSSSSSAMSTTTSAAASTASKNIVQIAESNPDFSTLVSAVSAAGLVSTLEGPGPYTVFAPTNEAFAALPAGTLQTLLEPANKAELTSILTYHVVAGALKAADIMPGAVKTVNGATFTVNDTGGKLTITDGKGNTADIIQTNIIASNGVIHVINAVLIPPAS